MSERTVARTDVGGSTTTEIETAGPVGRAPYEGRDIDSCIGWTEAAVKRMDAAVEISGITVAWRFNVGAEIG